MQGFRRGFQGAWALLLSTVKGKRPMGPAKCREWDSNTRVRQCYMRYSLSSFRLCSRMDHTAPDLPHKGESFRRGLLKSYREEDTATLTLTLNQVLKELKQVSNQEWAARSMQAGLRPENTWGVSVPSIRKIAKSIGRDHFLAQEVWDSKIHEAMILACMIDVPDLVTEKQMEEWVRDLDSWDVCDTCCGSLFDKSKYPYAKAVEWSSREEEFVKRASFALMASLAVHDKVASDAKFEKFLPIIARESTDSRHFVTKAVNWALRQIGKRNLRLNRAATLTAKRLSKMENRSSRWVGSDAYRELTSRPVQARLKGKHER